MVGKVRCLIIGRECTSCCNANMNANIDSGLKSPWEPYRSLNILIGLWWQAAGQVNSLDLSALSRHSQHPPPPIKSLLGSWQIPKIRESLKPLGFLLETPGRLPRLPGQSAHRTAALLIRLKLRTLMKPLQINEEGNLQFPSLSFQWEENPPRTQHSVETSTKDKFTTAGSLPLHTPQAETHACCWWAFFRA